MIRKVPEITKIVKILKLTALPVILTAGMLLVHFLSVDDIRVDLDAAKDSYLFSGEKRNDTISIDTSDYVPEWRKDHPVTDARLIANEAMKGGLTDRIPENMTEMIGNGNLELYIDPDTTAFAIKDLKSGDIWTSGPADTIFENIAAGNSLKSLQALLMIEYYTADGSVQSFDSFNHSVEDGQFTLDVKSDRIEIVYEIGNKKTITSNDVPNIISAERFEHFLDKMDTSQARDVKARYRLYSLSLVKDEEEASELKKKFPRIIDNDLYVLRNKDDMLLPFIRQYLEEAGYTTDDLAKDNADNGIESVIHENEIFTVPLTLILDGENLIVETDTSRIAQPATLPVKDVHILPFFGAANLKSKGYMFVPDGSGGLIYLNDEITGNERTGIKVYSEDLSIRRSEGTRELTAAPFPVFGIKNEDSAVFAVIENGAGCATVNYTLPGYLNTYNSIWPSFNVKPNDTYEALGSNNLGGAVNILLYPKSDYNKSLKISYGFLHGENASYSGFASYYRDHLRSSGLISPIDKSDRDIPFILETIGSIEKKESLFGLISYDRNISLTTFNQSREIVDALMEKGIGNISLRLSGWMNGGSKQSQPDSIKVLSDLGGEKGLSNLLREMNERSVSVYADVQIHRIRNESVLYSKKNNAVRFLGNTYANIYKYDLPSGLRLNDHKPDKLLTPGRFIPVSGKVSEYFDAHEIPGISLQGLAADLYSDFSEKNYKDRDDSIAETVKTAEVLTKERKAIFDGCNSYILQFADVVVNIPMTGSGSKRISESVPFIQMVLHGYIDYAGEPVNHSDDPQTLALINAETGALPYFQWAYGSSSVTKGTAYDHMFSLCYLNAIDSAAEYYHKINEDLTPVRGETIVYHENLSSTVSITEYENGVRICVNYDYSDAYVDGNLVPARGWKKLEG